MDFTPGIWGFGWFGHAIGAIVGALFSFFIFLLIIGLLFLFVRFLLVVTKAAHIYIAKNSPPRPVAPAAAATPPTTVTRPAPATKPRTPKTPPA